MKPCPWCGHSGEDYILPTLANETDLKNNDIWQMRCEWCGARGPEESNPLEALKSWEERNGNT